MLLLFNVNSAQKNTFKNRIAIQHDNDLYFGTDKYYTAGNFINYTRTIQDLNEKRKRQFKLEIGQQIITPTKKSVPDTTRFDRPFAGWLFLSAQYKTISKNTSIGMQSEIGVVGSQSLAGNVQKSYHRLIGEDIPSWYLEIPNDFHINFKGNYLKGFFDNKLISISEISLGSKDIYMSNGFLYLFAKERNFLVTSFNDRIGSLTNEFFFGVGAKHKFVFYNSLIEGDLLNNKALFIKKIQPNLFIVSADFFYRWNMYSLYLSYQFNTKEVKSAKSQSYLSVALSTFF
ncbi:MAG: hypothetical protein COZ75_03855 [Flavobacteriaceae bacterium CG_4_8_14_3_um_filter_34_10]|nr:lipid A deacylase LpxR family protein [Flavobacteriia bacterium]OIP52513.1 MAG: hypothetical protein AUK33_00730 [Flavobacteriaceae bacterium CG2_30_34_30]PIQ17833.1 MAG: hypothetical protein COW66_09640 [Flavobacteriaceae bacterium CG18_big_fil_WC_8_21_14_2_50_34_36]PIV50354.1 MAG: hypothetical protein COS19_04400 [Flavobacteriaceae bacterium CG02_land_8_20_14_3_00_34_13]PIX10005.1 MAG: hypothetical protein COZ75_03855 [Flavobacteriaceae bacterium CG_4_8_14_3_um_filter_34_10]PIZ07444.1 MAG